MKALKVLALTVAASAAAYVGVAQAAVINFYYGNSLVATIETTGNTTFEMDFWYAPAAAGTSFINDVLMQNTGGATLANTTFTDLGPEDASADYKANGYEGGPWNWKISFPSSNGGNPNRFLEGESTSWSIVSTAVSSWNLGSLHINAFLNGNSIKLTGCLQGDTSCTPPEICDPNDPTCTPGVPEPGMLALLGVGIAGLALVRRRRRA